MIIPVWARINNKNNNVLYCAYEICIDSREKLQKSGGAFQGHFQEYTTLDDVAEYITQSQVNRHSDPEFTCTVDTPPELYSGIIVKKQYIDRKLKDTEIDELSKNILKRLSGK